MRSQKFQTTFTIGFDTQWAKNLLIVLLLKEGSNPYFSPSLRGFMDNANKVGSSFTQKLGLQNTHECTLLFTSRLDPYTWRLVSQIRRSVSNIKDQQDLVGEWCHINKTSLYYIWICILASTPTRNWREWGVFPPWSKSQAHHVSPSCPSVKY